MKITRPTIRNLNYLELALEWVLAEVKSSQSLMQGSINTSLAASISCSASASIKASNPQVSLYIEDGLCKVKVFQKLLRLCDEFQNCNIFHQRVANFFTAVFKTRSERVITSIFLDNNIIRESLTKVKDFKKNGDYWLFIVVIDTFTRMRLPTEVINTDIEQNQGIWDKFYTSVLLPHVQIR